MATAEQEFRLLLEAQRQLVDSSPEFDILRQSNRGKYRVLRCDFPHLMGGSTLRHPAWLPRSIHTQFLNVGAAGLGFNLNSNLKKPALLKMEALPKKSKKRSGNLCKTEHLGLSLYNIYIYPEIPPLSHGTLGETRVGFWEGKDIDILVRMYNKSGPDWKKSEAKVLQEVCHLKKLGHPNFLAYYGWIENDFWKYHLFEYMPRGNLLKLLQSEIFLDEGTIRKIFGQIVTAVSYLHDKELVHRNLKLEKILIGSNFEVRLADIATTERSMAQNYSTDRSTIPKIPGFNNLPTFGPFHYRGPERALGWSFNPLLDQVWALGVILYAMFCRKFPFDFVDVAALRQRGCRCDATAESAQDVEALEKTMIEKVENGVKFKISGKQVPNLAKRLLLQIFQWEEFRPRSFELLDAPWIMGVGEQEVKLLEEHGDFAPSTTAAENQNAAAAHLLGLRRKMFKHFKLFREDYLRQPALQEEELLRAQKILENATRFLGPRPYGITELRENIIEQHKAERLYKEEYWPALYVFNPIKCPILGINRPYCSPRPKFPIAANVARLLEKRKGKNGAPHSFGLPPPRRMTGDDEATEMMRFNILNKQTKGHSSETELGMELN